MKTAKCLNCGHEQELKEDMMLADEYGKYTFCEECESSYDI